MTFERQPLPQKSTLNVVAKTQGTNMTKKAQVVIAIATAAGIASLAYGAAQSGLMTEPARFAMVLVVAVLAARLKVTLPGLTGSMAFNLPFLLLALTELPFAQAVAIAAVATLTQCLPFRRPGMRPVQALFNVATLINATALSAAVAQTLQHSGSANLALPIATAVFFVANTLPVAAVIAFTEKADMAAIWGRIFNASFASFVLSAGMTSMIVTADRFFGWQISLVTLAVMFGVRHCYKFYFAGAEAKPLQEKLQAAAVAALGNR